MLSLFVIGAVVSPMVYFVLLILLRVTQDHREPVTPPASVPFLDPALGVAKNKVNYLVNLKNQYRLPMFTLRMPFQRIYIINAPHLIKTVQSKINSATFVPTLLDFGILFSGLGKDAKDILRHEYGSKGNAFTKGVHKYLRSGPTLEVATRTAVDRLTASVPNNFSRIKNVGLLEAVRYDLLLALTGAVYGPENPYDRPEISNSWHEFVPGINHLLYSPFPAFTARKALRARSRVINAFKQYFATGNYLQAFAMIPEMHETNKGHGLTSAEAAKMEIPTSLAMLSTGAITTFWLMFHILKSPEALRIIRQELFDLVTEKSNGMTGTVNLIDLRDIRERCPNLVAMLHETFRYHSTVLSVKKVSHDTVFSKDAYLLKKDAMIMIPSACVHHDTDIWGPTATSFDHTRFLTAEGRKRATNTLAFRPFGDGATMCPGRHFSMNAILSLVAIVLLQYDVEPQDGKWEMPSKTNADMWNAMPKPDHDIPVSIKPRDVGEGVQWKFVWGSDGSEEM